MATFGSNGGDGGGAPVADPNAGILNTAEFLLGDEIDEDEDLGQEDDEDSYNGLSVLEGLDLNDEDGDNDFPDDDDDDGEDLTSEDEDDFFESLLADDDPFAAATKSGKPLTAAQVQELLVQQASANAPQANAGRLQQEPQGGSAPNQQAAQPQQAEQAAQPAAGEPDPDEVAFVESFNYGNLNLGDAVARLQGGTPEEANASLKAIMTHVAQDVAKRTMEFTGTQFSKKFDKRIGSVQQEQQQMIQQQKVAAYQSEVDQQFSKVSPELQQLSKMTGYDFLFQNAGQKVVTEMTQSGKILTPEQFVRRIVKEVQPTLEQTVRSMGKPKLTKSVLQQLIDGGSTASTAAKKAPVNLRGRSRSSQASGGGARGDSKKGDKTGVSSAMFSSM